MERSKASWMERPTSSPASVGTGRSGVTASKTVAKDASDGSVKSGGGVLPVSLPTPGTTASTTNIARVRGWTSGCSFSVGRHTLRDTKFLPAACSAIPSLKMGASGVGRISRLLSQSTSSSRKKVNVEPWGRGSDLTPGMKKTANRGCPFHESGMGGLEARLFGDGLAKLRPHLDRQAISGLNGVVTAITCVPCACDSTAKRVRRQAEKREVSVYRLSIRWSSSQRNSPVRDRTSGSTFSKTSDGRCQWGSSPAGVRFTKVRVRRPFLMPMAPSV
jgi:hypothetical protein